MNTSAQNPKPNWVLRTSHDLTEGKGSVSALGSRPSLFASTLWGVGCAFLLLGTPLLHAATLPNNFWVNPTFELGANLDQTDGTVENWNRGGNDPTICQVITNNSVSSGHSLAVIDMNDGDFYGEWYSDVTLGDSASGGDLVGYPVV